MPRGKQLFLRAWGDWNELIPSPAGQAYFRLCRPLHFHCRCTVKYDQPQSLLFVIFNYHHVNWNWSARTKETKRILTQQTTQNNFLKTKLHRNAIYKQGGWSNWLVYHSQVITFPRWIGLQEILKKDNNLDRDFKAFVFFFMDCH